MWHNTSFSVRMENTKCPTWFPVTCNCLNTGTHKEKKIYKQLLQETANKSLELNTVKLQVFLLKL